MLKWLRKREEQEQTTATGEQYRLLPIESDAERGFMVERVSDRHRLDWRELPGTDGLEAVPVVGTSGRQEEIQAACFAAGAPLVLVPEPMNPEDETAIGVWDSQRRHKAGFVPKQNARQLGPLLKDGEIERCLVMWETKNGLERVALRMLVVRRGAHIDLSEAQS